MKFSTKYPEVYQFMSIYRYCCDDLDMTDDGEIADKIIWHQGREDCEEYIRETKALMALEDFPWKETSRLSCRSQSDEQATRAWLENMIMLIAKRIAAMPRDDQT